LIPTGRASEALKSMGGAQKPSNHKFEWKWFEIRRGLRISSISASCPALRTATKGGVLVGTADAKHTGVQVYYCSCSERLLWV